MQLLHKSCLQTYWLFFFQKGLVHDLKHGKCSIIFFYLIPLPPSHTNICIYYFNNVFNNVYIRMYIHWYLLSHQNWTLGHFLHWYVYLSSHRPDYSLSGSPDSLLLYSPVCSLGDSLHTCHDGWTSVLSAKCPFQESKTMTILFTVISSAPNTMNSVWQEHKKYLSI